ncbi:hypothetical protein E2562_022546 [Oryza meyeriana var. granulata]|uniref:Uncharacterized protein n=1 Tax=Oryza meyeriana var. granulata TaxID=110450 RepID=A0A6G1FB80_9ORYZ|nr:hypothetical protein E2562_022546 [Oryza meyeriana var. granulata]
MRLCFYVAKEPRAATVRIKHYLVSGAPPLPRLADAEIYGAGFSMLKPLPRAVKAIVTVATCQML